MKKNVLSSSIAGVIFCLGSIVNPCGVFATPPVASDECAKELLLSYFPESIVTETLKKFNVSQDKWAGINKTLSAKDKEIVKTVEQKAATMNPNPLKDPQQRQAAVKLFRDTLLQVFSDAMKENGVDDSTQFQAMLDDIQQQKAKKFAMCMEKQKTSIQQASSSADQSSDEDDDYDDEDEDDSDDGDEATDVENEAKPATQVDSKSDLKINVVETKTEALPAAVSK